MEELVIRREYWAGKRVLVTGHTGFKGSWLALWLASLGARVSGYALGPATDPSLWSLLGLAGQMQAVTADVRDLGAVTRAFAELRPQTVFHLAAQSLVRPSYEDPVATYATNVMGTVHVLEAARRCEETQAVVIVTSDKCYENRESNQAYRETDPMGGHDPYSSSKGCAELVTAAYRASFFDAAKGAAAIASARAGNVIGGGDWAADRIVPDIVRAVRRGEPVRVRNPHAIRPWQHVLEPLSGYLLLAERLCEKPAEFAGAWNFGPSDSDAVSVEAIVTAIVRLWGPPASWARDGQPHLHEASFLKLDSSKARASLGWKPRLGLETALDWTVQWYKAHAQGGNAKAASLAQIERYMELASR